MINSLNVLTIISYIALNVDILLQIVRIYKTKSSRDISLTGLSIRYAATLVIFVKFFSLSDYPLILGQGLIVVTCTIYIVLAAHYYVQRKN